MKTKMVNAKIEVVSQPEILADDDRGVIEKLDKDKSHSVLRITSKSGTVRANHYHQHDQHTCYLIKGKIRYVERAVLKGSTAANPLIAAESDQTEYIIEPGQLFHTVPLVAHAMEFLADSEFLAITPRSGDAKEYENDVIRVTLIDPVDAATRAKKKK